MVQEAISVVDEEFLTVAEVAVYMRVCYSTALESIRRGEIPAVRIGKEWRVSRKALEEWAGVGSVTKVMAEQIAQQLLPQIGQVVAGMMCEAFSQVSGYAVKKLPSNMMGFISPMNLPTAFAGEFMGWAEFLGIDIEDRLAATFDPDDELWQSNN